jgi:hypothetical protein
MAIIKSESCLQAEGNALICSSTAMAFLYLTDGLCIFYFTTAHDMGRIKLS